jgi:Asp/Glu/hydantoin racemase
MRHVLLINPINPNTSASTTEHLAQTLRPLLPVGVQLTLGMATFGAHYIACEPSHAVAGAAAPQALQAQVHSTLVRRRPEAARS